MQDKPGRTETTMLIDRVSHYRNEAHLYAGLINLLLTLPLWMKKSTAVEVGSYIGESANILSLFFEKVICIDPHEDPKVKKEFIANTGGRNIELINATGYEASKIFDMESLGFVNIDAVHTEEAVDEDIRSFYPKVMENGYIGGHDYDKENPGVMKAVNNIFDFPDFTFVDSSWLVKKVANRAVYGGLIRDH